MIHLFKCQMILCAKSGVLLKIGTVYIVILIKESRTKCRSVLNRLNGFTVPETSVIQLEKVEFGSDQGLMEIAKILNMMVCQERFNI